MRFSIIIPNYNSEKWIEKCINSILNQTYKNFEIIIVDDMSTDNSIKIIKKLLRKEDKLIINKSKRLSGGTRNVGIAEAKGDYIICIDCDDWLIDDKVLEDINNKLNNEDIMYLGYRMISKTNIEEVLNITNFDEAFNNPLPAPWLKVVKTKLFKKCMFPEGTLYEDRIQNYILTLQAKTYTNLGRVTHCWNRLNENATTFNPNWKAYRFEYCGELYKLIHQVKDDKIKQILLNELKMYINSCNEMVGEL